MIATTKAVVLLPLPIVIAPTVSETDFSLV